eukprot:CAMPEP_0170598378 /NCGR_PEP_ID=MMETSP0224-20130122/16216_1 /TAXON_ID=285029 /ORGANISM="Togula jolla, Strain CCCM 725" /LENGTH=952 /DNA_ID=CAMNT_0010922927 /DNA_START=52 /DNA_END=2910 /DNA_ORIENTATION=+
MTAAAARKLQKDIDVALKKVDDGIDEFSHVWEQATTSSSNSQKEKLGEELKKSINKLQRLRVQIREWIAQTDMKNNSKDKLEDARRRIENDMQRFKEFERDLKTKAFSACALAKSDELELEEAEKRKYEEWLVSTIQALNDQKDEFEADHEIIVNKKSPSADEKSRLAALRASQERHQWHIKKLELILRALDNDAIDMTDLALVMDSVEYYLQAHDDPDYQHDEGLYECFDLQEMEDRTSMSRTPTDPAAKESALASIKEEPQRRSKEKEKRKKEDKKEKKKEEREKRAGVAAQPVGCLSPASKASGDANTPKANATPVEKRGGLDDFDVDEEKVQADQLLGEAEEFICKICQIHVVGCSPKLTNCSHLFCGDCIATWFAQHPESQTWAQRARSAGPERVVPCPVCKQPLNEKRDLYPVCGATSRSENLLLWRMLSSLKIMCQNHSRLRPGGDGRCDWVGEYGQYQKHARGCKNLPVAESGNGGTAADATSTPALARTESKSSCDDSTLGGDVSPRAGNTPTHSVGPSPAPSPALAPQPKATVAGMSPAPTMAPADTPSVSMPAQPKAPAKAPAAPATKAVPATETTPKAVGSSAALPTAAPTVAASSVKGMPATAAAPASAPTVDAASAVAAPSSNSAVSQAKTAAAAAGQLQTTEEPATQYSQPTQTRQPQQQPQPQPQPQSQPQPQLQQPQSQPQLQTQNAKQAASKVEPEGSYMAQATSAFEPTGPNQVSVQPGDMLQVLERHTSGWTYCRNVSGRGSGDTGWAPSWVVQAAPASEELRTMSSPEVNLMSAGGQRSSKLPEMQSSAPTLAPKEQHRYHPNVAAAPTPQHGNQQPSASAPRSAVAASAATPQREAAGHLASTAAPMAAAAAAPTIAPKAPLATVRVATSPFAATSPSQLALAVGDLVEIIERDPSGWTYGRKVCPAAQVSSDSVSALEGWFPDWCCTQK